MYRVVISSRAHRQLLEARHWWKTNRSETQANRWYLGFLRKLKQLGKQAERFGQIPERLEIPHTLRELHYGIGARPTHRAIFAILEHDVVVLTVRHLAEDELKPGDV